MDPFTLGAGIVGLGLQLFGGMGASHKAKEIATLNSQVAQDEQAVNAQKQQQMELSARRQQMEVFRNAQRLRAQATAAAVNQGASFGSGLQGGLSQITDQADFNSLGISQNLQIGENIFGINNDISSKKAQISTLQGQQATDTSLMSLGGALVSNSGTIGRIGQYGFGKLGSVGTGFAGPYI
jgi:hypothetical protein